MESLCLASTIALNLVIFLMKVLIVSLYGQISKLGESLQYMWYVFVT